MNWLLVIVVVAVLLIGGCVLVVQQASESAQKSIDHGFRITCYDTGWHDGTSGNRRQPPADASACVTFYAKGYSDGQLARYNPPEE
ncbi:MAG: hypothetical protein E6J42_12125 [Chloroflexi bacterium]|nr:MAG: hypothetical protein E6J42_12125 [Chloroflexota bacterium]